MNLKTKKIISSLLIAANLALPANITLAKEESKTHQEIQVYFNNEKIEFDQQPIIVNGRTKVPFRAIFETMGTVVYYRESDSSILGLTRDGDTIYHVVGTNKATINGIEKTYDSVSEIVNDRTLIPVRMVADLLSAEVEWKEKTKTVDIEKNIETNEFHKKIRGIMGCVIDQNFNPEDFKRYIDYQCKNWNMDPKQVILDVNMDLDRELYESYYQRVTKSGYKVDIPAFMPKEDEISIVPEEKFNSNTILVNKFNSLPDNYYPNNLYEIERFHKIDENTEPIVLKENVVQDFLAFSEAYEEYLVSKRMSRAKTEGSYGFNMVDTIGFHTKDVTATNFVAMSRWINTLIKGITYHERLYYISIHTYEDLETGLSFIVNNPLDDQYYKKSLGYELTPEEEAFASLEAIVTEEAQFLIDIAHKYGFVQRYPNDKEHITRMRGTDSIFRYVGKDVAKIMYDENLCLEEYCAKYESNTSYKTDIESTKKKVLERY